MITPYTMEKLNAERLKDLDREAVGLRYSMLARRNRRLIYHAALVRLGNLLIAAGKLVKQRGDKCIAGRGAKNLPIAERCPDGDLTLAHSLKKWRGRLRALTCRKGCFTSIPKANGR